MLLDKKEVLEILRCPKSGTALRAINNKLIAESSEEKIEYEIIDDYPVLIDFENSVLKKEDIKSLSSVIERHSYAGLLSIAKRLVSPPQSTTAENVEHIFNLLLNRNDSVRVLIVVGGSMGKGMEPFYQDSRIKLVSFDIYASPLIQFLADAHNIPFSENSFDAVIIQAVLEHALVPDKVVSEVYRVLKTGGVG